ncbi:MAG: arginine N-succinyltransferase [Pseudomonadota bacterium]
MVVVRAIKETDLDALMVLAGQVGSGMTSLKPDCKMLSARIERACASFAESIPPLQRDYLFVMEVPQSGRVVGVCAIKSAVGLEDPFYNYRIGTMVHSSRELQIFTRMETLTLCNDLTGNSELCSLILHPDFRGGYYGKLLSKSRFLFIAQFPHLFAERIIAEMRGYQSDDGHSPFYDNLARHFFKMDFSHADDLTSLGKKSFIAELMPTQPMYIAYLPPVAQAVIGKVHVNTAPARRLLEQEGMHFEGYVDIFDAGPVLQARVSALRAVRESVLATVETGPAQQVVDRAPMHLVSNTDLHNFRVLVTSSPPQRQSSGVAIHLSGQEQQLLKCEPQLAVRTMPLSSIAKDASHV